MEYLADLEELIAGYLDDQQLIGVGLALIQDGEIVHLAGYGRTRLDGAGIPVTGDTLFAWGSICKTICAALVMRLVERGVLSLDVPLSTYLPELRFSDPVLGRQVTLRHVLSHTTGLPMWGRSWGPAGQRALVETLHAEIPHYRFLAPPGTFHLYSNVVYCLAGAAAEASTGRAYTDLVDAFVFQPLAMRQATFDLARAITRPIALPHRRRDGRPELRPRLSYNDAGLPASFGYGSTLDLAQLACTLLNQGRVAGARFLSAESVDEMQRPQISAHVDAAAHPFALIYSGYGLGMQTGRYRGQRVARHGGITPGYQTFFDLFPQSGCGVAAQMTYLDEEAVMETVAAAWDTVVGLPPGGIVTTPAPASRELRPEAKTRAGTYLNVERGELAKIFWSNERLHLTWRHRTEPLVPAGPAEFYAKHSERVRVPVYFLPDREGVAPTALIYREPYQRIDTVVPGPAPETWGRLTGRYRDPFNRNPRDTLALSVKENQLHVSTNGRSAPLTPLGPHTFRSPLGVVDVPPDNGSPADWLQIGRAARYYRLPEA